MADAQDNTEAPRRKRVWYQYSLRSLIIFVTCVALVCSGLVWWSSIRHRTALEHAVRNSSHIGDKEKELFSVWIWQGNAKPLVEHFGLDRLLPANNSSRAKGVKGSVLYDMSKEHLVWDTVFINADNCKRRVFLFGQQTLGEIRVTGEMSMIQHVDTIIVTDGRSRLCCWNECDLHGDFQSASIVKRNDGEVELTITTSELDPFVKGPPHKTRRFLISDDAIAEIGEVQCHKEDSETNPLFHEGPLRFPDSVEKAMMMDGVELEQKR